MAALPITFNYNINNNINSDMSNIDTDLQTIKGRLEGVVVSSSSAIASSVRKSGIVESQDIKPQSVEADTVQASTYRDGSGNPIDIGGGAAAKVAQTVVSIPSGASFGASPASVYIYIPSGHSYTAIGKYGTKEVSLGTYSSPGWKTVSLVPLGIPSTAFLVYPLAVAII